MGTNLFVKKNTVTAQKATASVLGEFPILEGQCDLHQNTGSHRAVGTVTIGLDPLYWFCVTSES